MSDNLTLKEAIEAAVLAEGWEGLNAEFDEMFGGQQIHIRVTGKDHEQFSFEDDGDYKVANSICESINSHVGHSCEFYVRGKCKSYMSIFSDIIADRNEKV